MSFKESLKTEASIVAQVIRGNAFAETLFPRKRNRWTQFVIRGVELNDSARKRLEEMAVGIFNLDELSEKIAAFLPAGKIERLAPAYNARVDAGALWQAQLMGSAAGTPANYMALSPTVLAPAKGDTTLSGEIVAANGCARALGTYGTYVAPSTLNGSAAFNIAKTFTITTGSQLVSSAALFNASSSGSLFVETNISNPVTLQSAGPDSLLVTATINI